MKTPFKLRSGNNIGGRNGSGVKFKTMGSSPVKENVVESFTNFLFNTKQTEEGRAIGDLRQRMRHPNIEVRMKAERENRERLKKLRESKEVEVKEETPPGPEPEKVVEVIEEEKEEGFKPHEFTREGGDPYSYRTKEGGGYEFQSLKGRGGRTKGEWYPAAGGVAEIEAAYKESMGIKE